MATLTTTELSKEAKRIEKNVMLEVSFSAIASVFLSFLARKSKLCKNPYPFYTFHGLMTLFVILSVVHGCVRVASLPRSASFRPLWNYTFICMIGIQVLVSMLVVVSSASSIPCQV